MSRILVAATPTPGYVEPMLAIASALNSRGGYEITLTTSDVFRLNVEAAGICFAPLHGKANFDYRALDSILPERLRIAPGVDRLSYEFRNIFFDMIPDQHRTIQAIHADSSVDLILTDCMFLGTFPQLLDDRSERPPVISCGTTALFLITSRDRPPVGAPEPLGDQAPNYLRQHEEFHAALTPVGDYLAQILTAMRVPLPTNFFTDAIVTLPDRYLQLTGSIFEFPCSDLPGNVRFVGPIAPKSDADFEEPVWWAELDSGKPVALVTQGTVANSNVSELIEPAIQALSADDITVIVALATNEHRSISVPLPPNVHVVPFIPFDQIMPRIDVFVTNGDYGAVNQALKNGVPVVVAGSSEDKSFVAARVAWSGAGLDLQTERPSPDQLHSAVRSVLADSSFRLRARQIAENFSHYDALETIAAEIELEMRIGEITDVTEDVLI